MKVDLPSLAHATAGADFLQRETGATSWAIVTAMDDGFSLTCRHCGLGFDPTMEMTAYHFAQHCTLPIHQNWSSPIEEEGTVI